MAIHASTTPARAGERVRSLKSQIGPVTAAIRTMRKAERIDDAVQALAALRRHDPEIDSIPALRDLRSALADRIEADIALLDELCGDADIEQDAGEMPEAVDEDGGDIQDEPHDPETDAGAEEDEYPASYYHRDRTQAVVARAARQELDQIETRRARASRRNAFAATGVAVTGPDGNAYTVRKALR